jgi:hypothetical protein
LQYIRLSVCIHKKQYFRQNANQPAFILSDVHSALTKTKHNLINVQQLPSKPTKQPDNQTPFFQLNKKTLKKLIFGKARENKNIKEKRKIRNFK